MLNHLAYTNVASVLDLILATSRKRPRRYERHDNDYNCDSLIHVASCDIVNVDRTRYSHIRERQPRGFIILVFSQSQQFHTPRIFAARIQAVAPGNRFCPDWSELVINTL